MWCDGRASSSASTIIVVLLSLFLGLLTPHGRMAADYKLYPTYKEEFHQVFENHREDPDFGPLLVHMKVVDRDGGSAMDEDQWEAASKSLCRLFQRSCLM